MTVRAVHHIALASLATMLLACGSASFGHSATPSNFRACIAALAKPRGSVDLLSRPYPAGLSQAGGAIEFQTGGPHQQGDTNFEAPLYTTEVYLFDTPESARDASSRVRDRTDSAHYSVGRAVVTNDVAFITAVPAALPGFTRRAIRSCLAQTHYVP